MSHQVAERVTSTTWCGRGETWRSGPRNGERDAGPRDRHLLDRARSRAANRGARARRREARRRTGQGVIDGWLTVQRLAGARHKLHLLAAELGSGGRRLPGRGRRAERRVALCRRRLTVVFVVFVVVGEARVPGKRAPSEGELEARNVEARSASRFDGRVPRRDLRHDRASVRADRGRSDARVCRERGAREEEERAHCRDAHAHQGKRRVPVGLASVFGARVGLPVDARAVGALGTARHPSSQTRRPHPEQVVARRDEAAANEQATGDHDACTCLHARRAAHRTPSAR